MKKPVLIACTVMLVLGVLAATVVAQYRGRRGSRGGGRPGPAGELTDRRGVPDWEVDPHFKSDVFTFVRIRYGSGGGRWGNDWTTDYPDAELNFSYRLQQVT